MDIVRQKHPSKSTPVPSTLVKDEPSTLLPHQIIFDQIDGVKIRYAALKIEGAPGPSGLDAAAWKQMCTSHRDASNDLCKAITAVTRRLCSEFVDPEGLSALVACRLIALDKNPGARPIGIGETLRRIIARAVLSTFKDDILMAAGPMQLCAGQESGCEAAVHVMQKLFNSPEVEAVLLVDATNAFNSINRQTALRNIQHICPVISTILINTYRDDVNLFKDGEKLLSEEGTTQGDPLAMPMYALVLLPLINSLSDDAIKQIWYADEGKKYLGASLGTDTFVHSFIHQQIST